MFPQRWGCSGERAAFVLGSSSRPHPGLNALSKVWGGSPLCPCCCLWPRCVYPGVVVAYSAGVGNQLPCPGLFLLAKPSEELVRHKSTGCSPRGAPLLLPSLWELLLQAVAHPGVPCHAWTRCPSAFPNALGPVGAGRLTRRCPMAKGMVARPC